LRIARSVVAIRPLLANLTALVQHAQLAVPVAEINTDRHAGSLSGNLAHVVLRSWA
jgi:hypothetical protein